MAEKMQSPVTLVLGGARSGKSSFAESIAQQSGLDKIYLATAEAFDAEMETRISKHQQDRGAGWATVEEPVNLVATLQNHSSEYNIILIDCLTLWLSNLMAGDTDVDAEVDQLVSSLAALPGPVILVSNEVGQGIVPENKIARDFRDHAGRLHQRLAAVADTVYFVTAGLAQKLK